MGIILDAQFKALNHYYKKYTAYKRGSELEKGYKPDFVLINNNDYIILECETSTSRKAYVGGMLKAAHFLQNGNTGFLVFVIARKRNVTADGIAKHLSVYYNWIKDKTNLRDIYIIETSNYLSNGVSVKLCSSSFQKMAIKVI